MNLIDLTSVALSLLALAVAFATVKISPFIKEKVESEKRENLYKWSQVAIKAAEQAVKNGVIDKDKRKEKVQQFLMKKGYCINLDEVDNMIESIVNDLPSLMLKDSDTKEE